MNINTNRVQGRKQYYSLADKSTMHIAILSDTHAHLDACIAEHIAGSDLVIHAGDICDGVILHQLAESSEQVVAVAGNNDLPYIWPESQDGLVSSLADEVTIDLPGGSISVEHGHRFGGKPDHGELRRAHPDARMIVYGHSHKMVCDQGDSPWVVNPGAAGDTRNHGGPSCILLEASEDEWQLTMRRFDSECRLLVA